MNVVTSVQGFQFESLDQLGKYIWGKGMSITISKYSEVLAIIPELQKTVCTQSPL